MTKPAARGYIERYEDGTRLNHWFVALLFVSAGLSGLALFHPSLYFFTALFGGGPWTRILHPFLGLLMVIGFIGLFTHLWRENLIGPRDREWLRKVGTMVGSDESHMPPVAKYNGGQKLVFWAFAICLVVLLLTGFVFWRPWFDIYFPIPVRRVAVLLHAVAGFGLVMSVITHVYAAIWVKGSMRAMTRGTVTEAWARHNHPLWHADVTRGK